MISSLMRDIHKSTTLEFSLRSLQATPPCPAQSRHTFQVPSPKRHSRTATKPYDLVTMASSSSVPRLRTLTAPSNGAGPRITNAHLHLMRLLRISTPFQFSVVTHDETIRLANALTGYFSRGDHSLNDDAG
ncbi:hypothetical protein P152DRAFT_313720 [Eremomyces bilateralis CBS 781.70]|uniref:Uncharacterized protein n=1 Tax=Eremomyces bilateralis CBS 781.70 TaxID=1392243 RepID=A0A6G1G5L1_9PEZI|nr:uncharacterized protein P152DRAFT_313720 [Eremomyces bilateralis CBS 781.70]KAF1813308.1 hypothetical protein P152DRAFT_313720 [Eremomyces bilateralis CBS 781.70]